MYLQHANVPYPCCAGSAAVPHDIDASLDRLELRLGQELGQLGQELGQLGQKLEEINMGVQLSAVKLIQDMWYTASNRTPSSTGKRGPKFRKNLIKRFRKQFY